MFSFAGGFGLLFVVGLFACSLGCFACLASFWLDVLLVLLCCLVVRLRAWSILVCLPDCVLACLRACLLVNLFVCLMLFVRLCVICYCCLILVVLMCTFLLCSCVWFHILLVFYSYVMFALCLLRALFFCFATLLLAYCSFFCCLRCCFLFVFFVCVIVLFLVLLFSMCCCLVCFVFDCSSLASEELFASVLADGSILHLLTCFCYVCAFT